MIDQKYALKYSFPHSVVHINDNSAAAVNAPTSVADDPSLYSTLVVTPTPIGVDNKVITVTRSDILNTAFGLKNVTTADIKKYGQTITYPLSILEQGAPVRFMRVTPRGSTFAYNGVIIQWKIDDADKTLHIRFKTDLKLSSSYDPKEIANSTRLRNALLASVDSKSDDGWNQEVFIANVSAGRGKEYNHMATAVDVTTQTKKPMNVRYTFTTYDTRDNSTLEQFSASLVNTHPAGTYAAIDSVNTLVARRVEGSSVIIPYINEEVVNKVFNAYYEYLGKVINNEVEGVEPTERDRDVYKTISVDTFDIIGGKYLYNGTAANVPLPYVTIDKKDASIPSLDKGFIKYELDSEIPFVGNDPTKVSEGIKKSLNANSIGLTVDDDVCVGAIYLTQNGTSGANPSLNVVTSVNQYTGAVSYITIKKLKVTPDGGSEQLFTLDLMTNNIDVIGKLNTAYPNATVGEQHLVAMTYSINNVSTFELLLYARTESSWERTTSIPCIYSAIDFTSINAGNVIGYSIDGTPSGCFYKPGYMTIEKTKGTIDGVYVVGYNAEPKDPNAETEPNRDLITVYEFADSNDDSTVDDMKLRRVGIISDVVVDNTAVGSAYDVIPLETEGGVVSRMPDTEDGATEGFYFNDGNIYEAKAEITPAEFATETAYAANSIVYTKTTDTDPVVDKIGITTAAIEASNTDTFDELVGDKITVVDSFEEAYASLMTVVKEVPSSLISKDTQRGIQRYQVGGTVGSIYRVSFNSGLNIPWNYYTNDLGANIDSANGGITISGGSTGFFDDNLNSIVFKYKYSALMVEAFNGSLDPRIKSPTRCPVKYLFDGAWNTVYGQTILPYGTYSPADLINASSVFTEEEKDRVIFDESVIAGLETADIDVKRAMYDLTEFRNYQGIPEEMRPVGPGSGMSLHLDSGFADETATALINLSFANRFNNPNVSWDIGGWVDASDGIEYTFVANIAKHLIAMCKEYGVNKPYASTRAMITRDEYVSYFPDVDTIDWDIRENYYGSGGNCWIADTSGRLIRQSQRTLLRESDTSDLIQESNMRTLSQLVYLLQNKINTYLLEYNDDGVLKTLSDEVNNMFSGWVGSLVSDLNITFYRDKNTDGGDIVVCDVEVTFRGLVLRVPMIVNVNRRPQA